MCHDEHPQRQGKAGRGISDRCWKMHGFLFSSPEVDVDDEGDVCHPPEASSPTTEDEAYPTINSASEGRLPCGECLEADSETIPLPQFCSWGALWESLPLEASIDSESEWQDLEEVVDPDDGASGGYHSVCVE